MEWDIDRAVRNFTAPGIPCVRIECEHMNVNRFRQEGLCLRPTDVGFALVWKLTFGHAHGDQRSFYGFSIHEACLKATKWLKKSEPTEIAKLGAKAPKRQNKYLRLEWKRPVQDKTV